MSALRIRDVRLIVAAVGISAFGDMLLWLPLALHLQAMTGSPVAVSAMFLALFGPVALLGGVAGRLADRFENRRLLLIVSAAAGGRGRRNGAGDRIARGDPRADRAWSASAPRSRSRPSSRSCRWPRAGGS